MPALNLLHEELKGTNWTDGGKAAEDILTIYDHGEQLMKSVDEAENVLTYEIAPLLDSLSETLTEEYDSALLPSMKIFREAKDDLNQALGDRKVDDKDKKSADDTLSS